MTDTIYPFALGNKSNSISSITKNDESVNSPSSYQLLAGDGVDIVYDETNKTVTVSTTAAPTPNIIFPANSLGSEGAGTAMCLDQSTQPHIWISGNNRHLFKMETTKFSLIEYPNVLTNTANSGGICFNPTDSNIYVAEYAAKKIAQVSSSGVLLNEFSVTYSPFGLACDSLGNIWYTTDTSSHIGYISTAGAETTFAITTSCHEGITLGSDGRIWFAYASTSIGAITITGTLTNYTPASETRFLLTGQDGQIYFIANNLLYKVSTGGVFTQVSSQAMQQTDALTQAADTAIWATSANFYVQRMDLNTGNVEAWYLSNGSGGPFQNIVATNGYVFVGDNLKIIWAYPQ